MAYGYPFYGGYTAPQLNQPVQQPIQQPNPQINNIIWVQGEAGAKSYLVAPNTTVQLWDSERQTIYLKSADASGMPSIKTLDYTVREMPQNAPQGVEHNEGIDYATKEDLKALKGEIIDMVKEELKA